MEMIDLRSDTLSLPTPEMLQSIVTARLGDDSRDGDPTVLELEAEGARMLGKESALLTVSGSMSNTVALRTHAEPGAAAIVEESAHLYGMEYSAIASACGLLVMPVRGHHGAPDLDGVKWAIAGEDDVPGAWHCLPGEYAQRRRRDRADARPARCPFLRRARRGLHGAPRRRARLQCPVALGVDARELTRSVDSVSVCLSKGYLPRSGHWWQAAARSSTAPNRVRRSLGGAMRQAGIIAAPGLVALRTMIPRLREDHENARYLAARLEAVPGLRVDLLTVQSNIVNVDVGGLGIDAATFAALLRERSVRGLPGMGTNVRFVTIAASRGRTSRRRRTRSRRWPRPIRGRRSETGVAITAVLFDLDDTLFDHWRARAPRSRPCASDSRPSETSPWTASRWSTGGCSRSCTCRYSRPPDS